MMEEEEEEEEEEEKEGETTTCFYSCVTSGSPVVSLVWMRILPTVGSLQTDASAGSRTSPARRMDTPHNCGEERERRGKGEERERRGEMLTQITL